MIDAMHNAASGLRSEQKQIDVISNNVANMQTPGFKRARVNFVDVAAPLARAGEQQAISGNGTRISSTSLMFSGGDMKMTQNPLDLAIDGDGFFEVEGEDGTLSYTRAGQFHLDADGFLVTAQGQRLANGPQIPADAGNVRITSKGDVTVRLAGDADATVLGTIQLATFSVPQELQSVGDNRFAATERAGSVAYATPGENGLGELQQGYVELANVDLIEEMSALVLAQRAYQMNARVLQAADQVLETINNLRR